MDSVDKLALRKKIDKLLRIINLTFPDENKLDDSWKTEIVEILEQTLELCE